MTRNRGREITHVVTCLLWGPDEIAALERAFAPATVVSLHPRQQTELTEELSRADVAVTWGDIDERFLAAPHLRWVHADHAGLTRSARPEVFERGLLLTGSAGRSAPALAQHAFYFALALTFDAPTLLRRQQARIWGGIPGYADRLALWGKTLGVVGLGHTGREMARLGKAFGMRVVGYRRRADPMDDVDRLYSADAGDSVDDVLEQSDVVMLAASLSDETYHLLSRERMARMKPGAYVINIGRGQLIDQEALIDALHAGTVAGAGLDVTDPEPLPEDSPLWDAPNVLITPHQTPKLPDRTQRSIEIITENIRRYRAGEPLLNALTRRDIFTGDLPHPTAR
ncbi:D-2-hydroxyacid dehydrogenase [Myceligenerans pegani]|uniref:D-2-hydroxyacid dehydrogenase n=1 Tax=Myceligenerans pegani TaxID=2776917 RepID=A0ABR9N3Q2_9MICO|nr:D-2-hydroxyacid dehydrogenase [Myceligenerans sp. TRM 65318]MBE1878298.1 D-2-hydroxyacid dehydrogenase [Myceligenerans sp. TRM 65318]MBE3020569.1 D-2-hydroxyacid dehydrogenase [Myceligenerans sp. TRM 65318]